jgi:hypothetical protein
MPGRTAAEAVEVFTAADLAVFTAVDFTKWGRSTAADLADFTGVSFTGIDFKMVGSIAIDFTETGFSLVVPSDIQCGTIIPTMDIMATASLTPRRSGTTAPILPAITRM